MRQAWITRTGGPEVFEVREAPSPPVHPGQVRVRVEAAGVNFADVMARRGLYPDAPPLPAVVGYEVAGVVDAVGTGVSAVREGDPVAAITRFGGYASEVVVPEIAVFKRPEGLTAVTAAAIPVNYLTAFQAMVVMGGLRHAQDLGGHRMRVLVHAAAGGVGTAAADLARVYGAELLGTASEAKHDYARERGYRHVWDSRSDAWVERVAEVTGGRGVDLILDPVGGEHWRRSFEALADTGRLVLFGFSGAVGGAGRLGAVREMLRVPWKRFSPFALMNRNQGVLGINLGHLWDATDEVRRWTEKLLGYWDAGKLRPHVDRTFALEDVGEAHAYLESRRSVGKIVLTVE